MPTINMAARLHQRWFYEHVLGLIKRQNRPSNCRMISFKNCRSLGAPVLGNDRRRLRKIVSCLMASALL